MLRQTESDKLLGWKRLSWSRLRGGSSEDFAETCWMAQKIGRAPTVFKANRCVFPHTKMAKKLCAKGMDKCKNLGDSRTERVGLKYVMFTDVYCISGISHHFALLPDHRWLKPCGCRPVGRPNSTLVPCEKIFFLGNAFCIRNVILRIVLTTGPTLEPSHLPAASQPGLGQLPLNAGATGIEMANSFHPPNKKETVVSNLPFNIVLPFRAPTIMQTAFREGRHSISEMYSSHKL